MPTAIMIVIDERFRGAAEAEAHAAAALGVHDLPDGRVYVEVKRAARPCIVGAVRAKRPSVSREIQNKDFRGVWIEASVLAGPFAAYPRDARIAVGTSRVRDRLARRLMGSSSVRRTQAITLSSSAEHAALAIGAGVFAAMRAARGDAAGAAAARNAFAIRWLDDFRMWKSLGPDGWRVAARRTSGFDPGNDGRFTDPGGRTALGAGRRPDVEWAEFGELVDGVKAWFKAALDERKRLVASGEFVPGLALGTASSPALQRAGAESVNENVKADPSG